MDQFIHFADCTKFAEITGMVEDRDKTREELLDELKDLRCRIAELEASEIELKQTERALRESEERLKLVLDGSNDGFWDWDIAAGMLEFSPRWSEILGYEPEELEPHIRTWQKLVHYEDETGVRKLLDAHLLGQTPQLEVEQRLRTKTGEWKWVLIRGKVVARNKDDEPLRMVGTLIDITDRKWTEEALQQRNCELALLNHATQAFNSTLNLDQVLVTVLAGVRYLLDISACSIWLVDSETGELVCRQASGPNSEAVRGWRLPPEEGLAGWVVKHGQSLNVPDTRAEQRHFKQVDQHIGIEHRSIVGIPLWVKQSVIGVLHILDTSPNRFKAMDITLVEALAAAAAIAIENARLYEQAHEDAQTKSRLLHEVNHRVKNNLAAIIGLIRAEQRNAEIKNQPAYVASMTEMINRVQGLATVHRLLSSSEWTFLSLDKLANQIIDSALRILPFDKRVMVKVLAEGQVQIAPGQANSLTLVLNELVTNVNKYALDGRQVAHVTVRIVKNDTTVLLEFRDDGPGYPEAVINMEQFSVGLYLVKAIVQTDLRGTLTLHNDQGAVTSIYFDVES